MRVRKHADARGVTRRRMLTAIGSGAALSGAMALSATPVYGKEDGELPNENVDYTMVYPFPGETSQEVPAGDWVLHTYWWVPVYSATSEECLEQNEVRQRELLENYVNSVTRKVVIDGEEIENATDYYTEPYYEERFGNWAVQWKYATPPKGKRDNPIEFTIKDKFEEETEVHLDENCETATLGPNSDWRHETTGTYVVTNSPEKSPGDR